VLQLAKPYAYLEFCVVVKRNVKANRLHRIVPVFGFMLNHKTTSSNRIKTCTASHVGSRNSVVGIATGYGLDDGGVGVRFLVGSRIFSSPRCPDVGPPSFLSNGYLRIFPRSKVAGAWSWPLTSNYCQGQENVDLYIHSPIWLHGVVLN
jgi:hypothetical protein